MISNVMVAGTVFAFVLCAALFVASCIIGYKFKGNAGGALMAFLIGIMAAWLTLQVPQIFVTLLQINRLLTSDNMTTLVSGYVLVAVVYTAVNFGIKYYMMYYLDKTGIGKYKCTSAGTGYAAGIAGFGAANLLSSVVLVFSIKNGTFLTDEILKLENADEYIAYQESVINAVPGQYFVTGLQFAVVCLLNYAVIMFMTRRFLKGDKFYGSIYSALIIFAYETINYVLAALSGTKNPVLDEKTYFVISAVVFAVELVALTVFIIKILKNFPNGREKFVKSSYQRAAEQQQKQTRSAWASVNALNDRNSGEDEEETSEKEGLIEEKPDLEFDAEGDENIDPEFSVDAEDETVKEKENDDIQ